MSKVILKANERSSIGTNASKAIRHENKVPAVLFGKGLESKHLSIEEREIDRFLAKHHTGSTLHLEIGSKEEFVILKNVQYHPVTHRILHVDFQQLQAGVAVRVSIPIFIHGKEDLRNVFCQEILSEVEIECLPRNLVDSVDVQLGMAVAGDQLTVGELEIFKSGDITPVTDPDSLVYVISELKENVIEETTEEQLAEPELIGAKKEEE